MLPSVFSVIDHRWRQNVGRTKKWHRCFSASHFDVFCDLLLNDVPQHGGIYSFYIMNRKRKRETCLVPLDCSRICASSGISQVTNTTFRLCFFFSSLPYTQTVPPKHFENSVPQRSHTMVTVAKISSSLGIFKSPRALFVSVSPSFLLVNSSYYSVYGKAPSCLSPTRWKCSKQPVLQY